MNFAKTIKKFFIIIALFLLFGIFIGGIYLLIHRQSQFANELRDIKGEYVPMRDLVAKKPQQKIVEMVTSASIWRPVQDHIKDAVVQIIAHVIDFDLLQPYRTPTQGTVYGSGFFINDQGELVTNAHVIDQATEIWLQIPTLGKRIIIAYIVGVIPERDLALLRVSKEDLQFIQRELGNVPYLSLGDSDLVRRSDDVLAVGYPLGQTLLKVTSGEISGREQHLIQISAPINPGSSGGPLLNVQAEVIGINAAGVTSAQNVGYAIPINELKIVLPDLYKNRLLRRPFLGFAVNNGVESIADYLGNPRPGGSYVVEVFKGSSMERAGLLRGDMIYEINGYPVDPFGEMTVPWSEDKIFIIDYVGRLTVGQDINLVVYRHGERKELHVRFDPSELPAIPRVYPGHEEIDYEVFAGMVVMQLTKNHIQLLANQAPGLSRYTEMRLQTNPTLVITHIFPNSQLFRCRNVALGSTINEVNGVAVHTLSEYRQALKKGLNDKFLTFRSSDHIGRFSDNVFTVLPWEKIVAEEEHLSHCYHYPITQTANEIINVCRAQHVLTSKEIVLH